MLKNIALIPRRADLAPADFRHHYETSHAPLAVKHLRGFAKYVRNYVIAAEPPEPGFDSLSEFWFADAEALKSVLATLESAAGTALRLDEERFMDRSRNAAAAVEEHLLHGAPREVERRVTRKWGLLFRATGAEDESDLHATARRSAERLIRECASSIHRVVLDLPVAPRPGNFPFGALLTIWPAHGQDSLELLSAAIEPGVDVVRVSLDSFETPPHVLES